MRRLVLGLLLATLVCGPTAVAAPPQPKPTAKDRADARAFVAAGERARRAVDRAAARLPDVADPGACGGALGGTNPASAANIAGTLVALAMAERLAPITARLGRELKAVHARDPVLRAWAAAFERKVVRWLAPYGAQPPVNVCRTLAHWQRSGYDPGFDVAADTGVDARLVDMAANGPGSEFGVGARLNRQVEARLVAFGITRKAAHRFVE